MAIIMRHKLSTTVSRLLFGDFRYRNYSSARMRKQTVLSHMKNNQFDGKDGGAFEDAAKSPNTGCS